MTRARTYKTARRCLLALLLCLLCLPLLWGGVAAAETGATGIITDFHTDMAVDEKGVYTIEDTVTVNFLTPHHGLVYTIPTSTSATRQVNGKSITQSVNARVSEIQVSDQPYTVKTSDGSIVLHIGDADTTFTGSATYTVRYKYDVGGDSIPDYDDVYFNLLGTNWEYDIQKYSFQIAMPKEFDTQKINVTTGRGLTDTTGATFSAAGTVITGQSTRTLTAGTPMTIRVELPNGYFQARTLSDNGELLLIAIFGGMALLAAVLFLAFGKDKKPVCPVEVLPPDGLTPPEVGYIVDGTADNKDILCLLFYWAQKGYMRIDPEDEKGKVIRLTKIVDNLPENSKRFEHLFWGGLFAGRPSVCIDSPDPSIHSGIQNAKSNLAVPFKDNPATRLYTKVSCVLQKVLVGLALLPIVILILRYALMTGDYGDMLEILVIGAVLPLLGICLLLGTVQSWHSTSNGKRVVRVSLCFLLLVGMLTLFVFIAPANLWISIVTALVAAGAVLVITAFALFMQKRTEYGQRVFGRILGFKHFLQTAEQPRLQLLLDENPGYFYDVLPYAYVLGVTDKWAKKFERLAVQPPSWYGAYGGGWSTWNTILFVSLLDRNMYRAAHTVAPQSSGGSGGIGGGFSGGGGFGGGGFGGSGGGGW